MKVRRKDRGRSSRPHTESEHDDTLTYAHSETLTTTGGSDRRSVIFYLLSGPCSVSGTQLTANSGTGSCSVAATKAGDSIYNPVNSAS